jgi:hypothetical protein
VNFYLNCYILFAKRLSGHAFKRWEDGLAEQVEYNSDGNIKTQVVRSPFVQVCVMKNTIVVKMFFITWLTILVNSCPDSFGSYQG